MDIASYMNSGDIAAQCRKIGYHFSTLEATFCIGTCLHISLIEKHALLRELMRTAEDDTFPEGSRLYDCYHPQGLATLFSVLEQYLSLEEKLLEKMRTAEPQAVYLPTILYEFGEEQDNPDIYTTYEKALSRMAEEIVQVNEEDCYGILRKKWLDTATYLELIFSKDKKPIFLKTNLMDEDDAAENILSLFDLIWVQIPTPFQKGDLLYGNNPFSGSRLNLQREPMVLTEIPSRRAVDGASCGNTKYWDASDMTAYGDWLSEDGTVFEECMHNYLNLEYYRGTLKGDARILQAISSCMKGKISIEMLLSAQEMIRAECTEMCAVPKWDYTEECYQDAGISDILKKRNAQSFWES